MTFNIKKNIIIYLLLSFIFREN